MRYTHARLNTLNTIQIQELETSIFERVQIVTCDVHYNY